MITFFKNIRIMFLTTMFLGEAFILLLTNKIFIGNIETPPINPILTISICIIWSVACVVIFTMISIKKWNKTVDILFNDCNPQKYISVLDKMLSSIKDNRRFKSTRVALLTNLSLGYLMAGDFLTTKKILDSIDFLPNNRYYSLVAIIYYNTYFDCYLNLGDLENAKLMQEKLKSALENHRLDKTMKDKYYYTYLSNFYNLNIASGDYSGAIDFLQMQFDRFPKLLNKVEVKYQLGRLFLNSNEWEKAKQAFEYVISNGGSTFYVKNAKDFLNPIKA